MKVRIYDQSKQFQTELYKLISDEVPSIYRELSKVTSALTDIATRILNTFMILAPFPEYLAFFAQVVESIGEIPNAIDDVANSDEVVLKVDEGFALFRQEVESVYEKAQLESQSSKCKPKLPAAMNNFTNAAIANLTKSVLFVKNGFGKDRGNVKDTLNKKFGNFTQILRDCFTSTQNPVIRLCVLNAVSL